jgi:phosphate/sulfate permease
MIKAVIAVYLILAILISGLAAWRVKRLKRWKVYQIALFFILSPLLAIREAIIIALEAKDKSKPK